MLHFEGDLVALEPVAGHGVIRLPGGELKLLEEEDVLPGTEIVVEEVLEDRLVLLEELPGETPRSRKLWWFVIEEGEVRSRIQVLDPLPPEEEPAVKPEQPREGKEVTPKGS
ncbi:MAG: hypothetical protein K0U98_24415 [Deltaproteobacteria bacterium]|nr:hypothetical protein [Deltaproteobacteria bacterium]